MAGKEPFIDPRTWRVWRLVVVGGVGGLAFELAPKFIPGLKQNGHLTPFAIWVTTGCLVVGLLWAMAFSFRAFRAGDEFRRASQQFAWFKGGLTAMVMATPLVGFFVLGGLPLVGLHPPTFRDSSDAFAMGYVFCVFVQMIGYLVVRAWWRVTKQ